MSDAPRPSTLIVAPTEEAARARAGMDGLTDGEWATVDEVADLVQITDTWREQAPGFRGGLLFADGWRDAFPLQWPPGGLGMPTGGPSELLAAAHAADNIVVEVAE